MTSKDHAPIPSQPNRYPGPADNVGLGTGPKAGQPRRVRSTPAALVAAGLAALCLYSCLGTLLIPLSPARMDTYNFAHWVSTNFDYASSPIDISVLSPFQGLGGLVQPLAVWIHPAYIVPRLLSWGGDMRPWSIVVGSTLMGLVTWLLARAVDLPIRLQVVCAQVMVIFSFPPMWFWSEPLTRLNGAHLYTPIPGVSLPTILGTLLLVIFSRLGRLSYWRNIVCMALLPLLVVYAVLCDPLYTAVFWIPIFFFLAGVLLGSGSRRVFLWRAVGGLVCLGICLGLNLHGYYRALFGYAARAVFPNELYVEIQKWDFLTGLFFQGGLATAGMTVLLLSCILTFVWGTAQMRGLAASVFAFVLFIIVISLVYVYSGIHWNQPLPVYIEMGAHPAYVVVGFLGLALGFQKLGRIRGRTLPVGADPSPGKRGSALGFIAVLLLPFLALAYLLILGIMHVTKPSDEVGVEAGQRRGAVTDFLVEELAIGMDGRFRGSVANMAGVPGGEIMRRLRVPDSAPFNKDNITVLESYLQSFDRNLLTPRLWDRRIPTLEDNNHLITPPFHFLFSRAPSRPQDYHSRNWVVVTKADPKLMAALGARMLLTDQLLSDPLLTLRAGKSNVEGVNLYVYEIAGPNVGGLCPARTVLSLNASHTVTLMTGDRFQFNEQAVVHDEHDLLGGLTSADSSAIYFEKGGVRVRARSDGECLLVLPIQFSNSLRILSTDLNSKGAPIRLLRVNLLETGILFDGEINLKIAHVFGPFRGIDGRLKDIEDCRRLAIKETGEIPYPPGYQPLAR